MSRASPSSPVGSSAARQFQPSKHHFAHLGGEAFHVVSEPSDVTVLQGELFGEKERRFLREHLQSESICFAHRETYKVWVRELWQHACLTGGKPDASSQETLRGVLPPGAALPQQRLKELPPGFAHKREGRFVICLHDMNPESELTTSWVFAKFLRAFYRKGLSMVMVDLPGFGKSTLSMKSTCSPAEWTEYQSHVLTMIVEALGISSCHVVACGESASILLRAMLRVPHRLEHNHLLINPVFDKNEIFYVDPARFRAKVGDDLIKPKNWRERRLNEQNDAFEDLLRRTQSHIWCMFDQQNPRHDNDTYSFIKRCSKNSLLLQQIVCTEVTREDVCEPLASREVGRIRVLVPSRQLKAACAEFLAGNAAPGEGFVPALLYVQHDIMHKATNQELGARRMSCRPSEVIGRTSQIVNKAEESLETRQGRRSSEIWNGTDQDEDDEPPPGRSTSQVRGPSSGPRAGQPLRPATWGRAAQIAREMLRPRPVSSAASVASGPEVDWEKAPFEVELSYGARKQLQDTLDESKRQFVADARRRAEREVSSALREMHGQAAPTRALGGVAWKSDSSRSAMTRSTGALRSVFL